MKTLRDIIGGLDKNIRLELNLEDALYQYLDTPVNELPKLDSLAEQVDDYINEQEIIYYTNAIEYLVKNDPSLRLSLELASDFGYETKDVNSELLATILYQENLRCVVMGEIWPKVEEAIEEALSDEEEGGSSSSSSNPTLQQMVGELPVKETF